MRRILCMLMIFCSFATSCVALTDYESLFTQDNYIMTSYSFSDSFNLMAVLVQTNEEMNSNLLDKERYALGFLMNLQDSAECSEIHLFSTPYELIPSMHNDDMYYFAIDDYIVISCDVFTFLTKNLMPENASLQYATACLAMAKQGWVVTQPST